MSVSELSKVMHFLHNGAPFDIMAYLLMLWRTFWCYGVLFDAMAYLMMLRHTF